jgi:GNAT superfamily N-acetyltransferase
MEIQYRPYVAGTDWSSYRELFKLSFPETLGTAVDSEQHYRWKFQQFPDASRSYQYVGDEDGRVVGYYAAIPYAYQIDGVRHRCAMVCDVMTHPGYRGRGIFTQIGRFATGELAKAGLGFTTGYPIRPEVIPGHLKVGWQVVQKMPTYVRPLGVSGLLPAPLKPLGKVADALIRAAQFWSLRDCAGYSAQAYDRDDFIRLVAHTETYARFLASWMAGQPNALVKDAGFLDWRTAAPGASYRFVALRAGEELVGVALARPTRLRGIETLAVLDFMVLKDHLRGCRSLHFALAKLARKEQKDVVACMAAADWAQAYRFTGSCYLRTGAVFSLIVKKLNPAIADESLSGAGRWHTFWIDSDDL